MSSYGNSRLQSAASANNAAMALEQSAADLALLNQGLGKSKRMTDRMSTLLTNFDDRLAKLERSLLPIHKQTSRLTKVSKNIEVTMRSLDGLLGHHDLVDREKPIITQGPDPDNLEPYMAAIDRLVSASIALNKTNSKGQNVTLANMASLIQNGAQQLGQVFKKYVKDSSPSIDAAALVDRGQPFPPLSSQFIDCALPLFTYLRGLPEIGPQAASEAEKNYALVRATYLEDSLKNLEKGVLLDAVPSMVNSEERRGLGRFIDVMIALVKSEYTLLDTVWVGINATSRNEMFAAIIPSVLTQFFNTGQNLNTLIKNSLDSLVTLAFASFAELQERSAEFDEWLRNKPGRKDNELGELLHAFRGSCLSSLPGVIEETRLWSTKPPPAEANPVKVAAQTINVVSFMKHLSENQGTAETFLIVLGLGNWGGSLSKSPLTDDEDTILSRYIRDVLNVLLSALDTYSKALRVKPGVKAVFLVNNVSYVRREIMNSQISDFISEQGEDLLNKKMRGVKAEYLEIWSPLVSALLDAGIDQSGAAGAIKGRIAAVKGIGETRETKDRFVRFFDSFDEIEATLKGAKLDDGGTELKERIRGEVERMVVPTYSKFAAKHRGEFSKNATKYVRMDGDELTARIAALFE